MGIGAITSSKTLVPKYADIPVHRYPNEAMLPTV